MMLHASARMAATRNAGHHCLLSLKQPLENGLSAWCSCSAIYEVMSLFENWDSELNHLNSVFSKLMQLNVPRNVRQSSAKSWYAISTSGSRRTKPKSCRTGHYHKTLIPVCPEKNEKLVQLARPLCIGMPPAGCLQCFRGQGGRSLAARLHVSTHHATGAEHGHQERAQQLESPQVCWSR